MNPILEVQGLCKTYEQFALRDISFSLPGGTIMGFIGQNGAGKTTTMKSILGMVKKDAGTVRLFAQDFEANELSHKEKLGVVMDYPFYVDDWKLMDIDRALSPFYANWNSAKYLELLRSFGLDTSKRIKELSRGMKVKLMLSAALSHDAKLLILDEPTSGLDPVARDELMELLQNFVCDEQHSILFSTHITADLEKIADYITFIQDGKLIFSGEKDRLLEDYVLVKGGRNDLTPALRERLLGLREHSVGFEGMLHSRDFRLLPHGVVTEAVRLDDVMVYMNKEGKHR